MKSPGFCWTFAVLELYCTLGPVQASLKLPEPTQGKRMLSQQGQAQTWPVIMFWALGSGQCKGDNPYFWEIALVQYKLLRVRLYLMVSVAAVRHSTSDRACSQLEGIRLWGFPQVSRPFPLQVRQDSTTAGLLLCLAMERQGLAG